MRSTNEILCDLKDNKEVSYEELKMAVLVLDSINFFNHNHLRRLLSGGVAAELTKKEFPDAHAELGISQSEYKALKMDPYKYLSPLQIPGTEENKQFHKIATNVFNAVMKQ